MPNIISQGAGSAQGFGFAARATAANYIEDVFSTYLYTGNGSTQTITNGIDLAGNAGLIWIKSRNNSTFANSPNVLTDSVTGFSKYLISSATTLQQSWGADAPVPTSTGFNLPINGAVPYTNYLTGSTYASWTFRKQAKFFDVVTYTGTGANRTISHNLGSVPGAIWVKRTDVAADWQCYHRSLANTQYMVLNTTAAVATGATRWNSTTPTSTVFSLGTSTTVNANGGTYVAYLFAHNAGGFGASGTDNVISCGTYNGSASAQTIELGYEPQFVIIKNTSTNFNWNVQDIMRGMSLTGFSYLTPNTSDAENSSNLIFPTATGFSFSDGGYEGWNSSGSTYIYIAIRRGPMRTPTSGTSVFAPIAITPSTGTVRSTDFPADMLFTKSRNLAAGAWWTDRLRGFINTNAISCVGLNSSNADAELAQYPDEYNVWNNQSTDGQYFNSYPVVRYRLRRAPGFFDVVCYTGTASARTVNHNLGVVPEMMIVKNRSNPGSFSIGWYVYHSGLGGNTKFLQLNTTAAVADDGGGYWNSTTPTSTVFSLGASNNVNYNAGTFVNYLFATCPGVSKVGSYTGTGALQTVNCGFTSGARFVLIKRTDSTGDWYVYDSARGITSGSDPYLLLNSTAAEVTGTNYVDTDTTGFKVTAAAPAGLNANGGSYIFLAIA